MNCCEHPKSAHRGMWGEPHSGRCKRCDCKGPLYSGKCTGCGEETYNSSGKPWCGRCGFRLGEAS